MKYREEHWTGVPDCITQWALSFDGDVVGCSTSDDGGKTWSDCDLPYRFKTEFSDLQTRKRFELTQHGDIEYFRGWLADLREGHPELAQYIIDIAESIFIASLDGRIW